MRPDSFIPLEFKKRTRDEMVTRSEEFLQLIQQRRSVRDYSDREIPRQGAAPASAAEKLTVLLDWFVNPDHATLIIAKEKGFFKNHGLEVDLVAPSDPNLPPKLVAAGKAGVPLHTVGKFGGETVSFGAASAPVPPVREPSI